MFSFVVPNLNPLLKKQVEPLFKSTRLGGLANIFAVWLVFSLVSSTHQENHAFFLGISVTILSIIRILVSENYLRCRNYLRIHLISYLLLTFLIGCAWGAFALMLISQPDQAIRNMVYLINFGMIAGSLATLSVWLPAYISYIAPQALGIFTVLALQGSALDFYFSIAFLVFILIMVSASLSFHRAFKRELLLKQRLRFSQKELKQKVIDRTRELEIINKSLEEEVKQRKQVEKDLAFIAYHDELTELPRKNLLIDKIETAISSAKRNREKIAVLFIDLDRFKTINDTLGHIVGDELIKAVSRRLKSILRDDDTVSRNGGDEFVIVLQRLNTESKPVVVAEKIINNIKKTFNIKSHKIHIGVSIGISLYPDDGKQALDLLRDADTAMFYAKKQGGNQYAYYRKSMSNHLRKRLEMETEIRTAVNNNEFYLVYQPKVNCLTGKTIGFEALLRWQNRQIGNIEPSVFIPLLEETGLIYDVGIWVLKSVISAIASGDTGKLPVAINLSALQCGDMELVAFISEQILSARVAANLIEFEITESMLINDFEKTEVFLNKIHNIGCTIALDDFGTGYTSMNYLSRLPIDVIKIDQSFMRCIDSNTRLENIVKAIVTMSESLGIKNIFEGVETIGELDTTKALGGKYIQGNIFSKPLSVDEMKKWVRLKTAKIEAVHQIDKRKSSCFLKHDNSV